jgi:hypothetical protein
VAEEPAAKQHRAEKTAKEPGEERMAREEAAAIAIAAVIAIARRLARHRLADRRGVVVIERAQAAAAKARSGAAKAGAGARLGEARRQGERQAEEESGNQPPAVRSLVQGVFAHRRIPRSEHCAAHMGCREALQQHGVSIDPEAVS